jgi:hypothetical protein
VSPKYALWGAARSLKGAAKFIRQDEIFQFFFQNLADLLIYGAKASMEEKMTRCGEGYQLS